jgi:Ca2+-binding RTX toxin-like protein
MVWRALVVLAFFVAITGSVYAFAAANTVPPTRLDDVQVRNYVGNDALKAQDFAPPECAPIRSFLTSIVYIGITSPTNASELVLGRPVADNINALDGNDCVLGGGGNDTINGGDGNDVILGGPGNDTLRGWTGDDVLIGGPGNDSFYGGAHVSGDICYRRFSSPPETTVFGCETQLPDPYDP